MPKPEYVEELVIELGKIGHSITMACVYSKIDKCYYVVAHVWLNLLHTWAPQEIRWYMEEINFTMLSKTFVDEIGIKAYGPEKKAMKKEMFEDQPIIESPEKESKFLSKIKQDVSEESFLEKYGITRSTYEAMCASTKTVVVEFQKETHIIDFHKIMFNRFNVLLSDTMKVLRDCGIIDQDITKSDYKHNYTLDLNCVKSGFGVNEHNSFKNTTYPVLYYKGLFTVLMVMHDNDLFGDKLILPLFK
jgi:hypothetical protein